MDSGIKEAEKCRERAIREATEMLMMCERSNKTGEHQSLAMLVNSFMI